MKKSYIKWLPWLCLIAVVCMLAMSFMRTTPLERDKDKEFAAGSGIEIDELSDVQSESLYKLGKVWGYAKYRHPSVVDGTLNWDAELFRVMPKVLDAKTGEEANEALYQWLNGFAFEQVESEEAGDWLEVQKELGVLSRDESWIADRTFLGEELCGYLEGLSKVYITDRDYAYAAYADDGTISFENEKMMDFKEGDDGIKLLSLFRFWNVYEYYSPNVEITKTDWDEVLKASIPEMISAETYRDYVLAVGKFTAATGDAHIMISDKENTLKNFYGKYFLPCSITSIDGQVVVTQTAASEKNLQAGDIITAVDGQHMQDRIAELSEYLPIPEVDKWLFLMGYQLVQTGEKQAEVQVIRDGEAMTFQIENDSKYYNFRKQYKNGFMEQNQVGYIDPSILKKEELEKLMGNFVGTKGIIVDLRNYPSVFIPYLLGEYITPEPKAFVKMLFSNPAVPGSFYSGELLSGAGMMEKMSGDERKFPFYNGKVVILMNEQSMSQSEFTIMALRQSPNAVVVGSHSIGADGNVTKISLPGNIVMNFTGLGVLNPDGSQTQRVGLAPDVECMPTVEGIKEGKDELVEKAIELILAE